MFTCFVHLFFSPCWNVIAQRDGVEITIKVRFKGRTLLQFHIDLANLNLNSGERSKVALESGVLNPASLIRQYSEAVHTPWAVSCVICIV